MIKEISQDIFCFRLRNLTRLLCLAGFHDPQLQDAGNSRIPNWGSFQLDTLPNGQVIKPDLFFMKAIKPKSPIHE